MDPNISVIAVVDHLKFIEDGAKHTIHYARHATLANFTDNHDVWVMVKGIIAKTRDEARTVLRKQLTDYLASCPGNLNPCDFEFGVSYKNVVDSSFDVTGDGGECLRVAE